MVQGHIKNNGKMSNRVPLYTTCLAAKEQFHLVIVTQSWYIIVLRQTRHRSTLQITIIPISESRYIMTAYHLAGGQFWDRWMVPYISLSYLNLKTWTVNCPHDLEQCPLLLLEQCYDTVQAR